MCLSPSLALVSFLYPFSSPSLPPPRPLPPEFRSRFQFITATFVTAMLSNSSSQVRKEGKTKPWQEEEKEERKNRAKQRASRTANTRDKKKRPLAEVVEGKEKERGSWKGGRSRRRQFLRKVVGRDGARAFFAGRCCNFAQCRSADGYNTAAIEYHRSHCLRIPVRLNWNFSLEARSTFRSIRRGARGPDGVVVAGRSTSMVPLSSSSSSFSPFPLARWEDLFVNTARGESSCRSRDPWCGGGNVGRTDGEGETFSLRGGYVTWARACRPSERCGNDLLDLLFLSAASVAKGRRWGGGLGIGGSRTGEERKLEEGPLVSVGRSGAVHSLLVGFADLPRGR